MSRNIVIGDIHGCFDELVELLDAVAPKADDQIIAIGDIVDRGPDSEKVLEFFCDTSNAVSIMGNHERKHIRSARGETRPALSQLIVRQQLGDRYEEWLAFMETLPRHVELPEAILVHGMFEAGISLEDQRDTVVIGTLTGEHYMEQHYPGPWYDHYQGPKPLIVGHHSYLRTGEPLIREGLVYAIDTGVAHGGRLTALILPEFRVVSVASRGDHWTEQRRKYAVMAGSSRPDLDLDWETLTGFAESAGTDDLPPEERNRAERCAAIAEECDRLVERVLVRATEQSRQILDELRRTDDWAACAPKKQAARYAKCVGKSPAAPLLFAARGGKLDQALIRRRAKCPRELARLAQQLGIEVRSETATKGTPS